MFVPVLQRLTVLEVPRYQDSDATFQTCEVHHGKIMSAGTLQYQVP